MKGREIFAWLVAAGLLVAVAKAYLPPNVFGDRSITGAVRVIDGDSLHVGDTEVRLFGVDAFEGRQVCARAGTPWRCGEAAADELRALTARSSVTCSKKDIDTYGRTVAVCNSGTVDLAAEMARAGLALAYREYSDDYVDEESEAHAARRGAWAGDFKAPWDWRGSDPQPQAQALREAPQPVREPAASSCRGTGIKGNISIETGERIYHTRESSDYERTRIDESLGERWFCTEEQAVKAGWRPRR